MSRDHVHVPRSTFIPCSVLDNDLEQVDKAMTLEKMCYSDSWTTFNMAMVVTIVRATSVCLFVCLFVCFFVCFFVFEGGGNNLIGTVTIYL